MVFSNIHSRRRTFQICFIITGMILCFITWTHFHDKEDAMDSQVQKLVYKNTGKKDHNSSVKGSKYQETQYNFIQNMESTQNISILNIQHIPEQETLDQNLCVKTKTPVQYIICTYPIADDRFVSGSIQRSGWWEDATTKRIFNVLNLKQNQPITFIDIGANIGYFSLLAAAAGHSVIAIEPWYRHVQRLTTSIQMNKFQKRITLIQNAVSNKRKELKFNKGVYKNLGAVRVISEQEVVNFKDFGTVKSILLNDIATLIHTQNVVLKLDIEGHECRALEKAESIFDNFKILLIAMEWGIMEDFKNKEGIACQDENIKQMVDVLTGRGFLPYSNVNDKQLDPKDNKSWKESDIYWKPRT